MKHLPYRPRFINKLYAWVMGYFWLPCPVCGNNFGGHEWREPYEGLMDSPFHGKGVCPKCGDRARELNRINGFTE